MAVAFIDRVDNLSLVERHGAVRSLTRKVRVIINPAENPKDFSVLTLALSVVPLPFSTLATAGYANLVLIERSPQLAENDPNVVDVILKYDHILDGPNQILQNPNTGFLFGKGKCSITEKSTNFFYPNGVQNDADPTANRVQLQTAYTYEKGNQGVTGFIVDPQYPQTIFQGGEMTIPYPQANFQMQGVLETDDPFSVGWNFIARINDERWLGRPAFTWICSEVQFDVIDVVKPLYRFSFEFQYNVDTWNPTIAFNDQRTGRPPAQILLQAGTNLNPNPDSPDAKAGIFNYAINPLKPVIPGVGPNLQPAAVWTVPALRPANFSELFAAVFVPGVPGGIEFA